jgi:thioredoxin 1
MSMIELTDKNFNDNIEQHSLLVIDFWAEWCGPCKSFMKVLEEIAPKHPEFVFGSVNIDVEKTLADEFQIRSIPAVMIMRDKVVLFAESGALSASVMMKLLDEAKTLDPEKLK